MSRSGYSDDLDPRDLAMWRGQVASIIRGKPFGDHWTAK
jgi:hypothetical protein